MTISMKQFLSKYPVKMSVSWADENPNMDGMPAGSRHFKCVLRFQRRRLTTYFSQGPAIEREPSVEDVLDCLAMDASVVANAGSFEDWCGEYGYDTDSRKAERTYAACQEQAQGLERLLGESANNLLLWETERA